MNVWLCPNQGDEGRWLQMKERVFVLQITLHYALNMELKEAKQYEVKTNTVRPFFAQFFAPASEGVSAAASLFDN